MLKMIVTADTNDADYITGTYDITPEDLQRFQPAIDAIKHCTADHNWPRSDYEEETLQDVYPDLDPDLLEEFHETYIPYSEQGVHTIEKIELWNVVEITKLI